MFIRDAWIKATDFNPTPQNQVLEEVEKRVRTVLDQGQLPIVIFDLDSTLFDVTNRSYQIINEWINDPESHTYAETVSALSGLKQNEIQYSIEDVWRNRKIPVDQDPYQTQLRLAKNFWRKRFFSNHYIRYDEPMTGGAEYVKNLHEMGAKITYLTGRDAPLMSFGTFDQLSNHQFPIEMDRSRLILKPKRHIDDLDYKVKSAERMTEIGQVVASFENEPKNLLAMSDVFRKKNQNTMNVFIETVCSDHPAPAGTDIYRIYNFKK